MRYARQTVEFILKKLKTSVFNGCCLCSAFQLNVFNTKDRRNEKLRCQLETGSLC